MAIIGGKLETTSIFIFEYDRFEFEKANTYQFQTFGAKISKIVASNPKSYRK